MSQKFNPVVLIIRDGWGENPHSSQDSFNAIKLAHTPVDDRLQATGLRSLLTAHGPEAGLPAGVMGNSEVGHQNIGAGRIVDQEIRRIDRVFEEGKISENETLQNCLNHLKTSHGRLHLMGLVSDAGVHSTLDHLYGLLKFFKSAGVENAFIHAFTDGRDSPPTAGIQYIKDIEKNTSHIGLGKIASLTGRYWAMDRDNRWERTEKTYKMLTGCEQPTLKSAIKVIEDYYDAPLDPSRSGDEFVPATLIDPQGSIRENDAVIFFNFRGDRPRQLTRAFVANDFTEFNRGSVIKNLFFATMSDYQKGLCPNVIFHKPPKMKHILGEVVSLAGLYQFRCAETEKFPHVTFFFNDYRDEPFAGEEREVIPSPKDVATYDLKPEMSARGVCEAAKKAIESRKYALLVVNFANADMVGHTGNVDAAKKACEIVDQCVGEVMETAFQHQHRVVVTADHGNADQMRQEDGSAHTAHTLNPVALYALEGGESLPLAEKGILADIAPTVLHLMGLTIPREMEGTVLLKNLLPSRKAS